MYLYNVTHICMGREILPKLSSSIQCTVNVSCEKAKSDIKLLYTNIILLLLYNFYYYSMYIHTYPEE